MHRLIVCLMILFGVLLPTTQPMIQVFGQGDPFQKVLQIDRGPIARTSWSPNGEILAVAGGYSIWLYNNQLEDIVRLQGHTNTVISIAWSPDSNRIASTSNDGFLRVWDVSSGETTQILPATDANLSVSWSPDGRYIANSGSSDFSIYIWDVALGERIATLDGHQNTVTTLTWSPDGTLLASSSFDRTMRFWDTRNYQLLYSVDSPNVIRSITWHSNGKLLLLQHSNMIAVWDITTEEVVADYNLDYSTSIVGWRLNSREIYVLSKSLSRETSSIFLWDWTSDEYRIVVANGNLARVTAWNLEYGRLVSVYDNILSTLDFETGEVLYTLETHYSEPQSITWSPDCSRIASGHSNGQIFIWDAEELRPAIAFLDIEEESRITTLAWSPDNDWLAAAAYRTATYIWSTTTFVPEIVLQASEAFAWSPDGHLLAISKGRDTVVELRSTQTWEIVNELEADGVVIALAWSPDGTRLAVTTRTISVYDANTGTRMATTLGRSGSTLSWSPDGSRIVSSGPSGGPSVAQIWDAATGVNIRTLTSDERYVWQPNGLYLASTGTYGGINLTDTTTYITSAIWDSHIGVVTALEWCLGDGTLLASSYDDYSIRIWEQ